MIFSILREDAHIIHESNIIYEYFKVHKDINNHGNVTTYKNKIVKANIITQCNFYSTSPGYSLLLRRRPQGLGRFLQALAPIPRRFSPFLQDQCCLALALPPLALAHRPLALAHPPLVRAQLI